MDSSEGGPGRILLVGGDPAAGLDLVSAITQQQAGEQADEASCSWQLDTRYYTAQAQFEVRQLDQCSSIQLQDGAYEAVLLLFDASQPESFAGLQRWWDAAGGADADLGVRLAVSTGPTARADQRPAWLAAAEEWCAEQLIEFVDAGPAGTWQHAAPEGTAAAAGAERAEATGVARIREALQAHMWPGMQLKPSPLRGAQAAARRQQADEDEEEVEVEEVEEAVPSQRQGQGQALPNGTAHASAAQAATSNGTGSGAVEDFSFSQYLRSPEEAGAAAAAGRGGGGQGEDEVEALDSIFAQVTRARDHLAQLPDAQRREAAAALAMQLMTAMGLDDDEEEEGEEEDEEAAEGAGSRA